MFDHDVDILQQINVPRHRENRRTISAMGRPIQNMIVSMPIVRPVIVAGRGVTRESGTTTKVIIK